MAVRNATWKESGMTGEKTDVSQEKEVLPEFNPAKF